MSFSERLKKLRLEAGLSQEGLARAAGISLSSVCKLEQGDTIDPSLSTVTKLAKALNVDCRAFMDQPTPPPEPPAKAKKK